MTRVNAQPYRELWTAAVCSAASKVLRLEMFVRASCAAL